MPEETPNVSDAELDVLEILWQRGPTTSERRAPSGSALPAGGGPGADTAAS